MLSRFVLTGVMACLAAGCGHTRPSGGAWGEDATLSPGWAAVKRAAAEAAADPYTWAPAAAAAALQIDDADRDLAADIRREKPLFGSAAAAADASDWLRLGAVGLFAGLGLGAPSPEDPARRRETKARGLGAGGAALGVTLAATDGLKSVTGRTRPNGSDDRSLPSGHASVTAAASRLSAETLDYYALSDGARTAADAGLAALTGVTGWARIEAGEHYPSDVLLGAALGNFVAKFITRAFVAPASGGRLAVDARPLPGGGMLRLYAAF